MDIKQKVEFAINKSLNSVGIFYALDHGGGEEIEKEKQKKGPCR